MMGARGRSGGGTTRVERVGSDRRAKKNTDLIKVKYVLPAMWVIILDLCINPFSTALLLLPAASPARPSAPPKLAFPRFLSTPWLSHSFLPHHRILGSRDVRLSAPAVDFAWTSSLTLPFLHPRTPLSPLPLYLFASLLIYIHLYIYIRIYI